MFDYTIYNGLMVTYNTAVGNTEKGRTLEEFASYFFGCLEGVTVEERDIHTESEEIDLVLWNSQTDDVLKPMDGIIFVECKNWSKRVDAKALDSFIGKLRRRSLKTGILVATNGITGGYLKGENGDIGAVDIIKSALQESIKVITITKEDLEHIRTIDDLKRLLKKRYCGIFIHKPLN